VWDLAVAVAIAVFIVVRAVMLGRQVVSVLAQHAPAGVDPAAVETGLAAVRGVEEVHDLHLWTLTSGMDVGTVHLVVHADAGSTSTPRCSTRRASCSRGTGSST